jgi:hypothetical protein
LPQQVNVTDFSFDEFPWKASLHIEAGKYMSAAKAG